MSGRVQVLRRSSPVRCAVCHAVAHASAATCGRCGVVAHRGCARALETCPSLGCAGALVAPEAQCTYVRRRPALLHAMAATALAASVVIYAASTSRAPRAHPTPAPRRAVARRAPPRVVSPIEAEYQTRLTAISVERLRSPDPIVRRDAALELGSFILHVGALPCELDALLTMAAHDPEPSVRARCDEAFAGGNAGRVRGQLVLALEHTDPEVRLVAADVLGRVPEVWSRRALLARVDPRREPDARVRAVAAARLLLVHARTGDGGAAVFDALARRAPDEPDSLVWLIIRAGVNQRDHASCALVRRTLPALIDAALRAPSRLGWACRDLLRGLDRCDAQAPLLATLERDDPAARALAATLLGRWLDEPEVNSALWRACREDDDVVRIAASSALAAEGTGVRTLSRYTACRVSDRPVNPTASAARRQGR